MFTIAPYKSKGFYPPTSEQVSMMRRGRNFTKGLLTHWRRKISLAVMPDPVCDTIVFCDSVITEQGTGKNTLIGTFHAIYSPKFPIGLAQFFVHLNIANYVNPANGRPPNQVVANLIYIKTGASLSSCGGALPVLPSLLPGPFICPLNLVFQNIFFQAAGDYEMQILMNGERIGGRILEIRQKPTPQQPPESYSP